MKKLLFLAFALILGSVVAIHADSKKEASINFAEKTHNFGIINEADGPVTCDFYYTNDGSENLFIIEATAQCGCTKPKFSKKPTAPGKRDKVTVTYNPAGVRGSFEKRITVRNNGKPGKVFLKIKGTVVPKK